MEKNRICEECGTELPPNAPQGLCPKCLIGMGVKLAPDGEGASSPGAKTQLVASVTEQAGDKIGHYKLLQKIGEGGCGVVYMAEQEEPVRRRVALKVVKLGMDTKQVIARFAVERQALAMMDHPNIAKVLEAGATDTGRPYFVMELVRGIRITDYCDQNNLSTRERLDLFTTVCQAIQHAHQKGIIHRDIKPSNILVTLHDGVPVPMVIDFGIAKATGQQRLTDLTVFTAFEQFIGTPAYMSPEQAELSGLDIDTRSDIYSLGVLLYELLTGKTPFDSKALLAAGLDEMRRNIREKEPMRPSAKLTTLEAADLTTVAKCRQADPRKLIHLIRGDLDWIVIKALEKDRTRRYETTSEMARDIQRHLHNEPVVARPPSSAYRFQKLIRRNKLAFAAGTALFLVLLLGIIVSTWQAVRAKRAERQAQEQAQRARDAANIAEQAKKVALEQTTVAETQRHRAEHENQAHLLASYVGDIRLAQNNYQQGNFSEALALLKGLKPNKGETDLRGFEWRHLWRLCRGNYAFSFPERNQVLGSMEFSPDSRMLATYYWDGGLRLWRVGEMQPVFELTNNTTGLGGFSADGDTLVFSGVNGVIQRYRISQRSLTNALANAGDVLAFSARANLVVTISGEDQMKVWNLADGQCRFTLPGKHGRYLEFGAPASIAPDGSVLALIEPLIEPGQASEGLRKDRGIHLWDLRSGKDLDVLEDHRQIQSLRFSPDGKLLAVGDGKGNVTLWDLSLRRANSFDAHGSSVYALAFSPDGKTLATGSSDETINQWDVATHSQKTNHLRGQVGAVSSLAYSPDGAHLASGGRNSPVKFWNPEQGETSDEIPGLHSEHYGNFAISPDGKNMAAGCQDHSVKVWDVKTLQTKAVLKGAFYVVAFAKDSRRLLVSGEQNMAYWFDTETNARQPLPGYSGNMLRVISVDLSPDRRKAALGHDDGKIKIWDIEAGKLLGEFQGHTEGVRTVSFSPDGNLLVSGGNDRTVKVFDLNRHTNVWASEEHKGVVCAAIISHDGRRFASACSFGTIKLWDPANLGKSLSTIALHRAAVRTLDFSQSGNTLASGGEDKTVRLWSLAPLPLLTLRAQREVASFPVPDSVCLVQFSPDDNTLAIVTHKGILRLLRAVSLEEADLEAEAIK